MVSGRKKIYMLQVVCIQKERLVQTVQTMQRNFRGQWKKYLFNVNNARRNTV